MSNTNPESTYNKIIKPRKSIHEMNAEELREDPAERRTTEGRVYTRSKIKTMERDINLSDDENNYESSEDGEIQNIRNDRKSQPPSPGKAREIKEMTPTVQTKLDPIPKPISHNAANTSPYRNTVISLLLILLAAVIVKYGTSSKETTPSAVNCTKFINLKERFPNQDEMLFKSLKSGVEGTLNRESIMSSVFTLFSTDEQLIQDIMSEIVKTTRECMKKHDNPISLSHKDLNTDRFIEDNTQLISEFKQKLNESKILWLNNVDQVYTEVVPSLHSFADTYNPLVSQSILYFTITVPERPQGKPVEYIVKYLQDKWKDLANNIREPLIARIVDQTFFIVPA